MTNDCGKEIVSERNGKQVSGARGLCLKCYQIATRFVRSGKATWEELVEKGLCTEASKGTRSSPFGRQFVEVFGDKTTEPDEKPEKPSKNKQNKKETKSTATKASPAKKSRKKKAEKPVIESVGSGDDDPNDPSDGQTLPMEDLDAQSAIVGM